MVVLRNIGHLILQSHRNPLNGSFTFLVVEDAVHFSLISGRIGILLKEASDSGDSLVAAAA
jgi:hypothetical protein